MNEEKSRFGNDETFVKNPDMMMKIQFENMKRKFDQIARENRELREQLQS